jgi:hypothetical protein
MQHQLLDLLYKVEKSIEWRETVADRFPFDFRNREAVLLLKQIKEGLPSLSSDQLIEAIHYYDDLKETHNLNGFDLADQDEIIGLLGTIGFHWKPSPAEFVERLISNAAQ